MCEMHDQCARLRDVIGRTIFPISLAALVTRRYFTLRFGVGSKPSDDPLLPGPRPSSSVLGWNDIVTEH